MLKWMFQGQLVLRTRCLECECFTERREDFQDISVPVQEKDNSSSDSDNSQSEYIDSVESISVFDCQSTLSDDG